MLCNCGAFAEIKSGIDILHVIYKVLRVASIICTTNFIVLLFAWHYAKPRKTSLYYGLQTSGDFVVAHSLAGEEEPCHKNLACIW